MASTPLFESAINKANTRSFHDKFNFIKFIKKIIKSYNLFNYLYKFAKLIKLTAYSISSLRGFGVLGPAKNGMRAPSLILKQRISIIPCKKYHKVDTRALMPKSYQTHCVCKDFNIKTLKNQCFFTKNFANFLPARSC